MNSTRHHSRPSLLARLQRTACALLAAWLGTLGITAQTTCAGFVATDANSVRLVDGNGAVVFSTTGLATPWTEVVRFGPRLCITDQAGVRILDRSGLRLGNVLTRLGSYQTVAIGVDRLVVVDDDRVRIVDRDGQPVGAPILKTGPSRQRVFTTANGNVVVVDDDRVRIFGRDGLPRGAPVLTAGNTAAQVLTTPSGLVVVVDDQGVRLFDENGVPRGAPIQTRTGNRPTVTCSGGRVVVTDDQGTRIFGEDGSYKAEVRKTGTNRQQVVIAGDRIIVIDDDRVQVSDLDGFPIGAPVPNNTPGQGRQTVTVTDDRIIITDGDRTQIFDRRTMLLITTIARVGLDRQQVTADGNRILIVEQNQTRIFGSDGIQRGAALQRSGIDNQYVRIRGNTILVIDTDRVRVLDRAGLLLRDVPSPRVPEYNVQLFDGLFTLHSNAGWVEIRDGAGNLQGQRISVSSAVQHLQCTEDRVLLVDSARLRFFTRTGVAVGAVVQTGPDPRVEPVCWRMANTARYGQGCGAPGRVPQLAVGGDALPGGTVGFVAQGPRPFAPMVFALGLSSEFWNGQVLPLALGALGAPNCSVLAAPELTLVVPTDSAGGAELPLRLPANASVVGVELFGQVFVADPAANAPGLAVSNGVRVLVGEGS